MSRLPPTFQKSDKSIGEERNVKKEILETLQCATTVGGFEKPLWGLRRTFLPLAPTIIVINDFEEKEIEVEVVELEVLQLIEVEQPTNFSS